MEFGKKELRAYLLGIFDGIYDGFNPSTDLYLATAEYLDQGLFAGFGQRIFDLDKGTPDYELAAELRNNVHVFSAFKSHHSAADLGAMIFDAQGGKRTFQAFEKEALDYFNISHNVHLKTEYRTSVLNARAAKQWQEIVADRDIYPYLTYETAGDERVRPDHEDYDGVTARFDSPFWRRHFPPNGFNCRCDAIRSTGLESGHKVTPPSKIKKLPEPPDLFKMNAGMDKVIFSPKHPAFTVDKRYKVAAKSAFDLPLLFGPHSE